MKTINSSQGAERSYRSGSWESDSEPWESGRESPSVKRGEPGAEAGAEAQTRDMWPDGKKESNSKIMVSTWSQLVKEGRLLGLQTTYFSLCPHMVEEARDLSRLFLRTLILSLELYLHHKYLPKAPSPIIIIFGSQDFNIWSLRGTQTFRLNNLSSLVW